MKVLFKLINVFIALVLVIAAIGVALLAFPIFGNQALIVRSGSMTPTIDVGSVVVVRDMGTSKPGDVIAFRSEKNSETIITHRVVEVIEERPPVLRASGSERRTAYKTQGDANEEVDGWTVKESQVIGKTFLVVPYIGKLLMFARSEFGLAVLTIVPAAFVILLEIFSILREIRKKKRSAESQQIPVLKVSKHRNKSVAIMLFAGVVLVIGGVIGSTFAFQHDTETSVGNLFQAAAEFPTPTPQIAQTLVVNEFLWNTTCGQNANQRAANYWIELYNGSGVTVDLKDWQFSDANNNTIQISNAVKLVDPGDYIVITKDGSVFNNCFTLLGTPETANLGGNADFLPSTTGGVIRLEQPNGVGGFVVIDRVEYGPTLNAGLLDTPADQSIARDPNGVDSALGNTFNPLDFIVDSTISPGIAN